MFDFEKKFLKVDRQFNRIKIRNSKLYCKNNHKLGYLYSEDLAILTYSKVLIYLPFKKFYGFEPNLDDSTTYTEILEESLMAFEENKEEFHRLCCRMCSEYDLDKGYFEKFRMDRETHESFNSFMMGLKNHTTSHDHKNNTKKFLKNIDFWNW